MTVQPHPYLYSLHGCSLQLHFLKCKLNLIIGCKLATTEYGAETFFQSQLVWCAFMACIYCKTKISCKTSLFFYVLRSLSLSLPRVQVSSQSELNTHNQREILCQTKCAHKRTFLRAFFQNINSRLTAIIN